MAAGPLGAVPKLRATRPHVAAAAAAAAAPSSTGRLVAS